MRGEFNQRFGQNSKDRPHMMSHLFPFTDVAQTDAATGQTGALHARLDARGSRLKVFYTNTSAEYHRGDASLIHTDPDGRRDVAHGPGTRVYHFAGTEHGLGVWPPTDTQVAAADATGNVERSRNLRGTVNYGRLLRACLVNLDRWVTEGDRAAAQCPPAHRRRHRRRSRRIDEGLRPHPGCPLPAPSRPAAAARLRSRSRERSAPHAAPGRRPGLRVARAAVDDDGNEVAGIAVPELRVPLATHTGWNLRHPDIGGEEQLLVFAGSTLPFSRTRAERETAGDPRPSIQERYRSREDYLAAIRRAATELSRSDTCWRRTSSSPSPWPAGCGTSGRRANGGGASMRSVPAGATRPPRDSRGGPM